MKILVTGGAGFIGSHLVERLIARGDALTVVDDFNDFYDPALKRRNVAGFAGRAQVIEADICNPAALRPLFQAGRFDAIVHLAARAGVRPSIRQPLLYSAVNITGTQNLLELAREFRVRKFVFASSSSVYGVNQKLPFAESDPVFHPISPYAVTKLAGESLCRVYHHLHGLETVCLRFFTVYGPRQRPDMGFSKFAAALTAGQPIEMFGDGSTRRDYTYVDDILQGVLAAIDRSLGCRVINLGESRTVELRELIRLLEKEMGVAAVIRQLPDQPGDVPVTYADISLARQLLGYIPQVPIEEGISRFVRWFRAQARLS